jgi:hypothetical protein
MFSAFAVAYAPSAYPPPGGPIAMAPPVLTWSCWVVGLHHGHRRGLEFRVPLVIRFLFGAGGRWPGGARLFALICVSAGVSREFSSCAHLSAG